MDNTLYAGNHRGALTIAQELTEETIRRYDPSCLLADPKEGRSEHMERVLRKKFPSLTPQPLIMRAQDALPLCGNHDTIVLALDTVSDTLATLQACRPSQRVLFQFCGKGPGPVGTRIAIQGTLSPGDRQTKRSVSLLLPTLSEMSRAASSRELTGPDPVTAAVLQPLRQVVSRQTAAHLAEKDVEPRDLTGAPLSLFFGQTSHPLTAVQGGGGEKYSQQAALALESAGVFADTSVITAGLPALMVVVALVIPHARTVHFMRVALTGTGKRSVAGMTSFVSPARERATSSASAIFTD